MGRRKDSRKQRAPTAARRGGEGIEGVQNKPGSPPSSVEPLEWVVAFLTACLLLSRLLVPTEAAALGETLWIAQLWLATALVWFWHRGRRGLFAFPVDSLDAAVWTLVAGHFISALAVLCGVGDKRAALNLLWEWVGLGVSFWLLRRVLQTQVARERLTTLLCAAIIGLAGLGTWQSFVWYPRTAAWYDTVRAELDQLSEKAKGGRLAPSEAERWRKLQAEFVQQGIPLEGPQRFLWEQRLKASREPFGMFALANTFAGILAVGLVLLVDSLAVEVILGQQVCRLAVLSRAVGVALIGLCLILTKSRTAWVGTLAALAVWGAGHWIGGRLGTKRPAGPIRQSDAAAPGPGGEGPGDRSSTSSAPSRSRFSAQPWLLAAAVLAALAAATAAAIRSGLLDVFVLTEAPKSLRYRLEYWQATLAMLKDHPVLGVGPGNFRLRYLQYKLPQSSEEIADPHNLFLDAWASAGLLGLLGLLAFLALAASSVLGNGGWRERLPSGSTHKPPPDAAGKTSRSGDQRLNLHREDFWWWIRQPLVAGSLAAFVLVYLYQVVFSGTVDMRLLALVVATAVAAWELEPVRVSRLGLAAAGAALVVHLLGAGGMEMPAVVGLLFVLVALSGQARRHLEQRGRRKFVGTVGPPESDSRSSELSDQRPRGWAFGIAAVSCAAAFCGCLWSATLPVWNLRALVATANWAALEGQPPQRVLELYSTAAQQDPWSMEPYMLAAQFAANLWQQLRHRPESLQQAQQWYQLAIEYGNEAVRRNPLEPDLYAQLSEWHFQFWQATGRRDSLEESKRLYQQAVRLYPTNSRYWWRLAVVTVQLGDQVQAARFAKQALRLDHINRAAGHVDKFLPTEAVESLRQLVDNGSNTHAEGD